VGEVLLCALETSRNIIMHGGILELEDVERIGMNIRDWIKQAGQSRTLHGTGRIARISKASDPREERQPGLPSVPALIRCNNSVRNFADHQNDIDLNLTIIPDE